MSDMLHGKAQVADYDAIFAFVFGDYKDFAKFMFAPASKALTLGHENFMVENEMKKMVGDEYMVIEDGRRVVKDDRRRVGDRRCAIEEGIGCLT